MTLMLNKALKWKLTKIGFYATWVCLRLVWWPYLIKLFHDALLQWGAEPALTDYNYCRVLGSLGVLCGFNYLWTAEVVANILCTRKKAAKQESDIGEILNLKEKEGEQQMAVEERKSLAPSAVPDESRDS